jgi:rRNA-processing protein FCF1
MQPLRLYLKSGARPEEAIEFLKGHVIEAKNLATVPAYTPDEIERRRNAYVDWVTQTERLFPNYTHDQGVIEMLYTSGYWEVFRIDVLSTRAIAVIEAETRRQIRNLELLHQDISRRHDRASTAPGHITVIDTNILLHYQLPNGIDWPAVVHQPEIRLVIPLRVIEELDAKKYSESEKTRRKARELLPKIRGFVGKGGTPNHLRDHATIEVYIEPGPRIRPSDADTEILETTHELNRLSGKAVTIVTSDTGMALRGETEGIPVTQIPDQYRRD